MKLRYTKVVFLRGIRIIIPGNLQARCLNWLHSTHPGIVRMKTLARSYAFWPEIDNIENLVKQGSGCQKQQGMFASMGPADCSVGTCLYRFLDPFMNRMPFVMIDAHSKRPEIFMMKLTSTEKSINVVRSVFARNGLCSQIVNDNGPQFVSEAFSNFMKSNGIFHLRSGAYHAATNGLSECFVQTFKTSMRAMKSEPGDINKKSKH